MKLLLLDVETAPNVAYVWRMYDKYIPIGNLIERGRTLCYTAKWLGHDDIIYDSVYQTRQKTFLKRVHKLLDEADGVIHYNGKRFDIPVLEAEFLLAHMPPPSPSKQIDLYQTVKRFALPSRKLDYLCRSLDLGAKIDNGGMGLWKRCLDGDPSAWRVMEEYNKHDVVLLERLYYELRPWIRSHTNASIGSDEIICPHCGSSHIRKKGFRNSATRRYARFVCNDCGTWFQSAASEKGVSAATRAI